VGKTRDRVLSCALGPQDPGPNVQGGRKNAVTFYSELPVLPAYRKTKGGGKVSRGGNLDNFSNEKTDQQGQGMYARGGRVGKTGPEYYHLSENHFRRVLFKSGSSGENHRENRWPARGFGEHRGEKMR